MTQRATILGFDGIRGLSALAVVFTHAGVYAFLHDAPALALVSGMTGVVWFFVLSGFLITSLLLGELESTARVSLRNFYVRRALRIFPLYYLSLALIAMLSYAGVTRASWPAIGLAACYVYNFVPSSLYFSILGHTWSLAVEEHFYLMWPALFRTMYPNRRLWLLGLLGVAIAVSYPLLVLIVRLFPEVSERYLVARWTMISGSAIAWGCLMALLLARPGVRDWAQRGSRWLALAGLCLYCTPLAAPHLPWSLPAFVQTAGIAALVVWVALRQTSRVVGALEIPPLRYLGRVSYGMYVYQGVLLTTGRASAGETWPLHPLVAVLLLCICVPVSYALIERPLLRLKSRFQSA